MLLPNEKEHHRRNLPHWQPDNAVFFITPRLKGSIPKEKIEAIRAERLEIEESLRAKGLSEEELKEKLRLNFNLYFGKFDALLDGNSTGPHWLSKDTIAEIWMNALFHFDDKRYKIICSTVMSNHAHFIFYKLDRSLSRTMKTLKGYSAREANKILNRTGEHFWQDESFDRVIRNRRELGNCINYILNNPVKIGLVKHWKDWKYNYIRPDFLKYVL